MNIITKYFRRNFQDDANGLQCEDHIYHGKNLRVIVSFNDYSPYSSIHFNESKITEVHEGKDKILVKYLFTLPFSIPYTVNNGTKIVRWIKPDVFKVIKTT